MSTEYIENRIAVGIDVGWSTRRRSCAFAVQGVDPSQVARELDLPCRAYDAGRERPRTYVVLARRDELITFLNDFVHTNSHLVSHMVVVLDGPINPGTDQKWHNQRRWVDQAARLYMGDSAQPMDIHQGQGPIFVKTTHEILACFGEGATVWAGGDLPRGLVVAETHPTVVMPLLLEQRAKNELPSRRHPVLITVDGTKWKVRAKSDWYWIIGAGSASEQILGGAGIRIERDHERRAGLFCLAMAAKIARNEAVAIGNKSTGIYAAPHRLHRDWKKVIEQMLMVGAEPAYESPWPIDSWPDELKSRGLICRPEIALATVDEEPRDEVLEKGDEVDLWLTDNAGVWVNHNSWMKPDAADPIQLHLTDNIGGAVVLARGDREDGLLWRATPPTLQCATARGFGAQRLSLGDSLVIRAMLQ